MCTSFCPQCGGDHLNDGPVCLACIKKAGFEMPRAAAERIATINHRLNLAADDDGEQFIPMTANEMAAMNERMATSPEPSF